MIMNSLFNIGELLFVEELMIVMKKIQNQMI